MATKFAPTSSHAFALPVHAGAAPYGRIAYIAGPAVAAVGQVLGKLPLKTQDATLDDLAGASTVLSDWDQACETLETAIEARDTFARDMLDPIEAATKLLVSEGHDSALLGAVCDERTSKYYELVAAVSDATNALATVPAPNAAALAYKVRALAADEFHLNTADNTYIVEAIDADAKAVLDAATAPNPWMRGPIIRWQKAYAHYEQTARAAQAHYEQVLLPADAKWRAVREKWPADYDVSADPEAASEIAAADYREIDDLGGSLWSEAVDARVALYQCPAPSAAELGVKLKLFDQHKDNDLCGTENIAEQMMHDARRFGRMGSHPVGDEALNDAFAGLRKEALLYCNRPENTTADEDDAADLRVDALETIVYQKRAATLEGVLAKLRIAFQHKEGEKWAELALVDPSNPEFIRGLDLADMFDQLFWSAIEDLARVAGVNLAEQGA